MGDIVLWKMAGFDMNESRDIDFKVTYVMQTVDDRIIDAWI